MAIHDTECPYWGQVSVHATNSNILSYTISLIHVTPIPWVVWHFFMIRWAILTHKLMSFLNWCVVRQSWDSTGILVALGYLLDNPDDSKLISTVTKVIHTTTLRQLLGIRGLSWLHHGPWIVERRHSNSLAVVENLWGKSKGEFALSFSESVHPIVPQKKNPHWLGLGNFFHSTLNFGLKLGSKIHWIKG